MLWFKHYSDAGSGTFLQAIMDKFGPQGYAWYFLLLELCSEKSDGKSSQEFSFHSRIVRQNLRISSAKLQAFLNECSEHSQLSWKLVGSSYRFDIPKLMKIKSSRNKIVKQSETSSRESIDIDKEIDKDKEIEIDTDKLKQGKSKKTKKPFLVEPIIIQNLWNRDLYGKFELSECKKISTKRITAIRKFEKEIGFKSQEEWELFFKSIGESNFLSGKVNDFKANFDWVLKPENAMKIIEGNYTSNYENKIGQKSKFDQVAERNKQIYMEIGEENDNEQI